MTKTIMTLAACITLLGARMALATPTPQQSCDSARIAAWGKYVSCVDAVLVKDAKGVFTNYTLESAAFAKCRHAYFKKWTAFQSSAALASSTCQPAGGARFIDNGDGTVTDNLSGLLWEKKDNLDNVVNLADPHDADNSYSLNAADVAAAYQGNGTAFTGFLGALNGGSGFAGANNWRLPTFVELHSIVLDFACTGAFQGGTCSCPSSPCIDATFGPTQAGWTWSATTWVPIPNFAWLVDFQDGGVIVDIVQIGGGPFSAPVRAVRGGL